MKPGATTFPRASTVTAADSFERSPIAAIESPRRPTSARNLARPVPSMTSPPAILMSNVDPPGGEVPVLDATADVGPASAGDGESPGEQLRARRQTRAARMQK